MGIEGLSAIGQRVAEIRSLVADPALALSGATTGTSSASSASTTFASALAEALAADGTTSGGSDALSTDGSSLLDALGLSGSSPADSPGSSSTDLLGSSSADLLGSLSGLSGGSSGLTASLLQALGLSGSSGSSTSLSALSGLGLSGTALLAALGVQGTTGTTSAAATSTGRLNADGVPADLAAYGNGHIPESALAPITGSSERMWAPAAGSLNRLIADAKADGVTIGVTDGYRSYDAQVSLVKTEGLYSQGGLAAAPGTSEHGWGMAADLKLNSTALTWMRANAGRYGFVESIPRESWHWSYHPDRVAASSASSAA